MSAVSVQTISSANATCEASTTPPLSDGLPGRQRCLSCSQEPGSFMFSSILPHRGGTVCSTLWVRLLLVLSQPECFGLFYVGPVLPFALGRSQSPRCQQLSRQPRHFGEVVKSWMWLWEHELRGICGKGPEGREAGTESIRGKAAHLPQHGAVALLMVHFSTLLSRTQCSPHHCGTLAVRLLRLRSLPRETRTVTHTHTQPHLTSPSRLRRLKYMMNYVSKTPGPFFKVGISS